MITNAPFSDTQLANIKAQFDAMDTDLDGHISESEFRRSMQNASRRQPSTEDAHKFFEQVDTDKDGKINLHEFVNACDMLGLGTKSNNNNNKSDFVQGKMHQSEIDEIFNKFDLDGNGVITAEELGKVLESQGEKLTAEELDQMIKAVDKNGDNAVDKEEFAKLI
ncbi:hypothetical protein BG004_006781 [Podila humilis]|nr:hypothetical protein BG004_006781 [Podila humilis]